MTVRNRKIFDMPYNFQERKGKIAKKNFPGSYLRHGHGLANKKVLKVHTK